MRTIAALLLMSACSSPKPPEGTAHPATLAPESAPATEAPATEAPATEAAPASLAAPMTEVVPAMEAVKITAVPTPEQQARADVLAADILAGKLNRLASRQPENAMPFLHLAASHPSAAVVGASLEGMSRTWRRTGKSDVAPLVDADYTTVVRARLTSTANVARSGALAAARLLLTTDVPDEPTLATVLKHVELGQAADRIAASAALMNVRDFQLAKPAQGTLQSRIVDALLAGLAAPEPQVTAALLDKLSRGAHPEIARRDNIKAAAESRLTHEHPGVRGTAALLLARIARAGEREAAGRALLPNLAHESAYVKGATVEALTRLEFRPAIHAIMPLLDLDAEATLTVEGFTDLDGTPGRVELLLEGGQRMDAVVLNALRKLTGKAFDFKGGVTAQSREGLVTQAKTWYAANSAKYPKP
jgi:hypothetical protein